MPDRLLDIARLKLANIEDGENSGLRVGALVTNTTLASDPRVRKTWPLLSATLLSGAKTPPARLPQCTAPG